MVDGEWRMTRADADPLPVPLQWMFLTGVYAGWLLASMGRREVYESR